MAAAAFDQRSDLIWFDGKLVATSECQISVLTHGLHYASCVFEGERAYGGAIFKGTEHSERLKRSANILDFEIPYSVAEIDAAKRAVVDMNAMMNCYVRAIAWRGSEQLGVTAALIAHAFVRCDEQHGRIRRRRTGHHVLQELAVTGRVDEHKGSVRVREPHL